MVDVPPMVLLKIIEKDPSVTSPEDERDAKVSDVYHDSALPPARGAGEGVSISPQYHISIAGCSSNGVLQHQKQENPGGTFPQDLNEDHHMGGMGLEGVDSSPNAPCSFLHEEIEASVFSSLIKQAAGHPQDSLVEETGIAHPTSINIDGGSQCIKDNSLSLRLQDILRLENSEDLSCAGRTMQAKGFDFGGTSKFSELSGGDPHVKSSQSENADVLNDNHSEVEKPKMGEFESKEKGTDIDSGRITRSRSFGHQENSLNASGSRSIGTTSSGGSC
ncbi:hypothetical protein M0R45_035749 [Rubus argutus]|uniref:Uncharacterized protein n=1 Tax=Rubus argutus TaxID=59490 RepID=A0AAW1VUY5_RUBAR